MQSLIETVVKMLVDKPDEVNVEAVESDQTIIYELTVGDGDYGKVIGKKGRNVSALRTILFAIKKTFSNKMMDSIKKDQTPIFFFVSMFSRILHPNVLSFIEK